MLIPIKAIIATLGSVLVLLALLVTQYEVPGPAIGGAPPGMRAFNASTSRLAVGTTAAQIIATSTCVSRIVSTETTQIELLFGNEANQDPVVGALGFIQAASTTEHYDAAIFGCGTWRAIAPSATNITLTEFLDFR